MLVLDNFEQVLPAATAVAELANAVPSLRILVTSRASLNISAEYQYHLAPLPLPSLPPDGHLSAARLRGNAAVELFVDRARAVVGGFELTDGNAESVARICHRIDGLPLAVELAAARVRALPPDALLKRLDARVQLLRGGPADVPTHQRTLRDTIAWSYDLLEPPQRDLFATCAVFAGGCTLDALEDGRCRGPRRRGARCRWSADQDGVLETVESLVSQSLLRRREVLGGIRFFMLQTIRDFAWDVLATTADPAPTQFRHADYYRRFAEQAVGGLAGPDQADWLSRLNAERDNFRAALAWSTGDRGDPVQALRLAGSLARYWEMAGALEEGERWLESALRVGATQPPELLLPAYSGAGTLAWANADYDRAEGLHRQALDLARQTGNRVAEAFTLNNLAAQANDRLDFPQATALWSQAKELALSIDDRLTVAMVEHNLGGVPDTPGDFAAAVEPYRDALRVFRALGNTWYVAGSLRGLALTALRQGDYGSTRGPPGEHGAGRRWGRTAGSPKTSRRSRHWRKSPAPPSRRPS